MMKEVILFCLRCLVFVAFTSFYFGIKAGSLLYHDKYKNIVPGREIYWAIDKSKKKTNKKKLVLGDSTGNQFFNNQEDDDSVYSLACNQAIGMVGHFILLHNFLQAGNRPNMVCLVLRPYSLGNNLDDNYTYHYFLKTLYCDEYKPLMTKQIKEEIRSIPYFWLCHFPTIQTTTWAPKRSHEKRKYSFMSPISKEYLLKMDSLSQRYHFKFLMVPTILAESKKKEVGKWSKEDITGYAGKEMIEKYLMMIDYLPDSCFYEDRSHLRHPYLYKNIIISEMKKVVEI